MKNVSQCNQMTVYTIQYKHVCAAGG